MNGRQSVTFSPIMAGMGRAHERGEHSEPVTFPPIMAGMGRAHERAPARELYTVFRDFRAILGLARGGVAVTGRFTEKRPGTTTPTRHGIFT